MRFDKVIIYKQKFGIYTAYFFFLLKRLNVNNKLYKICFLFYIFI